MHRAPPGQREEGFQLGVARAGVVEGAVHGEVHQVSLGPGLHPVLHLVAAVPPGLVLAKRGLFRHGQTRRPGEEEECPEGEGTREVPHEGILPVGGSRRLGR